MRAITPRRLRAGGPAIAFVRLAACATLACALLPPVAFAHDDYVSDGGIKNGWNQRHAEQHGGMLGHLLPSQQNVEVVSSLALKNVVPEKIADVGVSENGNYEAALTGLRIGIAEIGVAEVRRAQRVGDVDLHVAAVSSVINASPGNKTRQLEEGETITGPSVFVGRACPGDPPVPAGGGGTQIAVVERGVCTFTAKVAAVLAAGGYEAILVFNRTAQDGCATPLFMDVEGNIPTFGVAPREQGFAIFDLPYARRPASPVTAPSRRRSPSGRSATR
ncbi:MAG: hypothetical protein H0W96_17005 [Solirubrobacterales bacterium]|nr:hypothetical protein [Solirubrobacterales bacterium]